MARLISLSDEIYSRIFRHVVNDTEPPNSPGELLLASVARRWRDLALRTAEFWTTVRITHDRDLPPSISTRLSRTDGLPLDIYIRLEQYRYRVCTEYTEGVDLLIHHIGRWRSLHVQATNPVLHMIRLRIQNLRMPVLERLAFIQTSTGPMQHIGPLALNPAVFRALHLERAMIFPSDASLLGGLTTIELVQSSLAMLDEQKLLSVEYPTQDSRLPSMINLERLSVDGSNPTREGLPFSPAFSPAHLTFVRVARLHAPSMDRVQALSRFFGTAFSSPVLRVLEVEEITGFAWTMLLSVISAVGFPAMEKVVLKAVDGSGVDVNFLASFEDGLETLVLADLRNDHAERISELASHVHGIQHVQIAHGSTVQPE
ncbi:unnamed protein product [Mycena citricolor]|uniref:F-box domain-containing protein n=1 Tax=Mycena citricolor TaxID=2018698 RepID=A0AAD2JYF6_9AGAR|nr:unnamed protein product [Mycena citricolor]